MGVDKKVEVIYMEINCQIGDDDMILIRIILGNNYVINKK